MVSLLLADVRIDVNKPMDGGFTPFYIACEKGHKEVVSLLLADVRIDVNKPSNQQLTPFGWPYKKVIARYQATRDIYEDESDEDYTMKKQNGLLIATCLILSMLILAPFASN